MKTKTTTQTTRKLYGIRLSVSLMKNLRVVSAKLDMKTNHLLEEGIQDLLKKYKGV